MTLTRMAVTNLCRKGADVTLYRCSISEQPSESFNLGLEINPINAQGHKHHATHWVDVRASSLNSYFHTADSFEPLRISEE